jgi:hypothetical protein
MGQMQEALFRLMTLQGAGATAVFSHHDLRTNEVTWYFSPEAAPVAMLFGAEQCEKPGRMAGLALSAGAADAWQVHFPGYSPTSRADPADFGG